jgi:hypothetical protein
MSATDPTQVRRTVRHYEGEDRYWYEESAGYGWVVFAGIVMLMLATMNGIDGIAAVSNSKFYSHGGYIVGDLNTWGWVLIGISVLQGLVGVGVMLKLRSVRWFGVAIAAVNAIVQLLFIPAYPFWSLALFALDLLVIYGLVVHGAREQT